MTASLAKCMRCGSTDLTDKVVEKLVRGGAHVVALQATATVCHSCGERYFASDVIAAFEAVKQKLEHEELGGFQSVGKLLRPTTEVTP